MRSTVDVSDEERIKSVSLFVLFIKLDENKDTVEIKPKCLVCKCVSEAEGQ